MMSNWSIHYNKGMFYTIIITIITPIMSVITQYISYSLLFLIYSKITSEAVSQQLIVAEETEKKIDLARMGYRSAAIRASLAYFVLGMLLIIISISLLLLLLT
jgi:hypothetical protein